MKLTSIIIKKLIKEELNSVLEATAGREKVFKLDIGYCKKELGKYKDENLYPDPTLYYAYPGAKGRDLHDEYWNAPNKDEFLRTLQTEEVAYLVCTANRFSIRKFSDELRSRGYEDKDIDRM